jgi:hypothetical protein
MKKTPRLEDVHLIQVCDSFLQGNRKVEVIADELNARFGREGTPYRVTREQIYPLLREARDRGFFELRAPLEGRLHQRVADVFGFSPAHIDVVAARNAIANDLVASQAARVCLRIIKALALIKKDGKVHVGLGAGATTLSVAQHLAAKLRAEESRPQVVLHALTSGFHVDKPQTAPVAFFGLFRELQEQIGYVGLFAPSVVKAADYPKAKTQPGVKEGFDRKGEVDVVITSLASRNDPDGELNRFLRDDARGLRLLEKHGWVGDVQYRPYSASGPIQQHTPTRAVTLFEVGELVKLAQQKNKHVILAAGPCGKCGRTREDALLPLMTNKHLKLWTHLVLDLGTAEQLVGLARQDVALS